VGYLHPQWLRVKENRRFSPIFGIKTAFLVDFVQCFPLKFILRNETSLTFGEVNGQNWSKKSIQKCGNPIVFLTKMVYKRVKLALFQQKMQFFASFL